MFALVTIPVAMVVVATVFLTLLAVGEAGHIIVLDASLMFVLTAVNLWNEHRDRRR